jgi:hypothetical protein
MNYYQKYLKYKQKYLQLQKMIGGNKTNLIELNCVPNDVIEQCVEKNIDYGKLIDGYDGYNNDIQKSGIYLNNHKIDGLRAFADYNIKNDTQFDLKIGSNKAIGIKK